MVDALQHVLEQVEQLDPTLQETLAKRFQQVIQEELAGAAGGNTPREHRIQELGWSDEEARQVRASLQSFAEDWDAPGMNAYR